MGGVVSKITSDINLDYGLNDSFNRLKNSFDRTPKYTIIDDKNIDPRSATLEINRTPLCLLDLGEEESAHSTPVVRHRKKDKRRSSRITDTARGQSSKTFDIGSQEEAEPELHLIPWEPRVLELGTVSEPKEPSADNKYVTVVEELRKCLTPVYVDNENTAVCGALKTPPASKDFRKKHTPVKKERTPLGAVNSNLMSNRLNPAALWRKGKIWRSPLEERSKLQMENTPPALPPFGSPCSAPPIDRYRHLPLK